jgi:ADP-ribose pyrophosphatase
VYTTNIFTMKFTQRIPTLFVCHWPRPNHTLLLPASPIHSSWSPCSLLLPRHGRLPCSYNSSSRNVVQYHGATTSYPATIRRCSNSSGSSSSSSTATTTREMTPSTTTTTTTNNNNNNQNNPAVPRAAVSIVARFNNKYALVQRGKEPNKGKWSFPGGKIELGEQSLVAAKRELWEETGLRADHHGGNMMEWNFQWCEHGPVSTTDSIHMAGGEDDDQQSSSNEDEVISKHKCRYHYVISHWFVEIIPAADGIAVSSQLMSDCGEGNTTPTTEQQQQQLHPTLCASDDAMDAMWFDLTEIRLGIEKGEIIPGIETVLNRSELMYEKGLLL